MRRHKIPSTSQPVSGYSQIQIHTYMYVNTTKEQQIRMKYILRGHPDQKEITRMVFQYYTFTWLSGKSWGLSLLLKVINLFRI